MNRWLSYMMFPHLKMYLGFKETIMLKFDVCYLNHAKQVVLITIQASNRKEAFDTVSNKHDCRKYHNVPNITSINQRASAPM